MVCFILRKVPDGWRLTSRWLKPIWQKIIKGSWFSLVWWRSCEWVFINPSLCLCVKSISIWTCQNSHWACMIQINRRRTALCLTKIKWTEQLKLTQEKKETSRITRIKPESEWRAATGCRALSARSHRSLEEVKKGGGRRKKTLKMKISNLKKTATVWWRSNDEGSKPTDHVEGGTDKTGEEDVQQVNTSSELPADVHQPESVQILNIYTVSL